MKHQASLPVLSPCTGICSIDPQSGLCLGCGRSLDEIAAWSSYPPATRRTIMAMLPDRLQHRTEKREPVFGNERIKP